MNARLAVLENELMVKQLIEGAEALATRKGITIQEAIIFRADVSIKYAKSEGAKAAWEIRKDQALNQVSNN